MKKFLLLSILLLLSNGRPPASPAAGQQAEKHPVRSYLGFDRNEYPGDAALPELRKSFWFSGFWLNAPPGMATNTWSGKRPILERHGFGFLVLFNGRGYAEVRAGDAGALGATDGAAAARNAQQEGFPKGTVIFLDQEEGGRLLAEQRAYLHAWVDAVDRAGYRAGVYCSGVPAREKNGTAVVTAVDIQQNAGGRDITYWVSNDACAPSPGCVFPRNPPPPGGSGVPFASVWQFAQSPRRKPLTASCAKTYHADGNCYAPGFGPKQELHVDLDTATARDPSHGRTTPD